MTPAEAARRELSRFDGRLIGPEDADYDEARSIYNAMIDRRPGLIAQCASPDDVAQIVGFARAHDLPLAVRGGGHNARSIAPRASTGSPRRAGSSRRPASEASRSAAASAT
jgi:hypothetical protein